MGLPPRPDPDTPEAANDEGLRLMSSRRTSADRAAHDRVVNLFRRAADATPVDHRRRAAFLSNLAGALQSRFLLTGTLADVVEAVDVGREAVRVALPGGPDRSRCLSNLAGALQIRHERTGSVEDLNEAIDGYRAALSAPPANDERVMILSNLGGALRARYERTGALADLDDAVDAARAAAASAAGNGHRYLSNLGLVLQSRYGPSNDVADLDEAVDVGRRALAATAEGNPDLGIVASHLAAALLLRWEHNGSVVDLNESVAAHRRAAASSPAGHPDHGLYLSSLAAALVTRHRHTGVIADLDDAVDSGRRAVADTPVDHPIRAGCLSHLGLTLQSRFERTGALADLDEAIDVYRQATTATPADRPDRAMYLSNLGGALAARVDRAGGVADIDEAVEVGRQALAATPTGHANRAGRLSNLGLAWQSRFELTDDPIDIDHAVDLFAQAASATPTDHKDRARYLSNLSGALRIRFDRFRRSSDIEAAITTGREATAAGSHDGADVAGALLGLGLALKAAADSSGDDRLRVEALEVCRLGAMNGAAAPFIRAASGRTWAILAADRGEWVEANRAWRYVFDILPQLADRGLHRTDRQHHLSLLAGAGSEAACSAIRTDDLDKAWGSLEQGRAVLLTQALDTQTRGDLHRRHPELAERASRLQAILNDDIGTGPTANRPGHRPSSIDTVRERHRAARNWDELMATIRAQDGFQRFGLPPSMRELSMSAAAGGSIVAVNLSSHGSHALFLTHRGASVVELPRLDEDEAVRRANLFLSAAHGAPGPRASATMHETLAWLWDTVTGPVLDHLGHTTAPRSAVGWPRLWWIPTSVLSVLPLHAAGHHADPPGPDRRAVLDRVISSYASTARMLWHARRPRPVRHASPLVVGIDSTTSAAHQPLALAVTEAAWVAGALGGDHPALVNDTATRSAVWSRLPTAAWVHFACHAAPTRDPANSHLVLYDGTLAARDLASLHLEGAYLAYLSACTTAFGGTSLLDESIHIASAFQTAGFPHVIATRWPVTDRMSLRFAHYVYEQLLTGVAPSYAVHIATRRVRHTYPGHPGLWASHVHYGP